MLKLDDVFKVDGLLAKQLPGYKPRPGQIAMAKAVESAIRDKKHLLDEAPTGTGKSLAYGVPAAIHALTTGERVVIATANITLQEQLAKKDLPLIAKMLEGQKGESDILEPLRFVSRKGLGNYVCLFKLEELKQSKKASQQWTRELWKWVEKHQTGDREDLPTNYSPEEWYEVAATSDECHKSKCRHWEECYAYQSRRTENSDIIVTNYHMLYADAVVKANTGGQVALLGDYDVLVMDEAHEAVDIAMGFQGFDLNPGVIGWLANRLNKLAKGMEDESESIRAAGNRFFKKVNDSYGKAKSRIFSKPLGFDENICNELRGTVGELNKYIAINHLSEEEIGLISQLKVTLEKRAADFEMVCFGVADPKTGVRRFPQDAVFFAEENNSKRSVGLSLCCKIVEVQAFLRSAFLSRVTVIGTSATLSTNNNFNFIAKGFGLEASEYASMISPSPFDARNMLVVVPENFPSPKSQQAHIHKVAESIEEVVSKLKGRSMALFASYRSLKYVSTYLKDKLDGVEILVQGEMLKGRIIQALKDNEHSLILATASFWQGVDIPGRALSCLFIEKFPFAPPTDPVLSYMSKKLEKETGDSFASFIKYSVPKAAISMKQGVGRLIRTEEDYGVVVIFDVRLETTSYGVHFECSFPEGHFRSGHLDDAVHFITHMDQKAFERSSPK